MFLETDVCVRHPCQKWVQCFTREFAGSLGNQNHPPLWGWTKPDSPTTVAWGVCRGLDNQLDIAGRVVDSGKIQVFQQGTADFAARGDFLAHQLIHHDFLTPDFGFSPRERCLHFEKTCSCFLGVSQPYEKQQGGISIFRQRWGDFQGIWFIHPWRLTWNMIMEAWKIIFPSKWVICRFHFNLPGCKGFPGKPSPFSFWFFFPSPVMDCWVPGVQTQTSLDFLALIWG